MKLPNIHTDIARSILFIAVGMVALSPTLADGLGPIVDDFSETGTSSLGTERGFIDDTSAGGKTRVQHRVEGGVLSVSGQILPPRGQPGWASTVLLLDPEMRPRDASAFEGIRLRVRINEGNLSVSANSSEVTNYDFHASVVTRQSDRGFHEVRIPFTQMQRVWSEKTPLNTKTIVSLSLVAFGMQEGPFDYEIDEVSFY